MRRRALLSSLAATTAAFAGCASSASGGVETTAPSDDQPTTDPGTTTEPDDEAPSSDDRPQSAASVVELETGPRTYSLVPTTMHTDDGAEVALWFDRTATDEHPARLRGYLENGNPYQNTFDVEWIPLVGRTHSSQPRGQDHEAALHAAPTEHNDLAKTVPGVVRDESGYWRVKDVGPWMTKQKRLDPGERVELEYVLVGGPEMSGRPTGTYEFRGDDEQARVAVWNTESPGPAVDSRFAGRSLPPISEDASVQWYHEADESTPAFLEPEAERLQLDGSLGFEMVNHSHETVRCGHWNLYKLVDGEWFHIAPRAHLADCRGMHPGERMAWSLRAFNGDPVACDCESAGACGSGLTRGYLGGGEYAVVAGYGHPADESAALVELVGDPVEIVPTEDASIEVQNGEAVVTLPSWGDGEHPEDARFALTRADSADERLLPEQVMGDGGFVSRGDGLRNALAAMDEGVDRVVVRADEHAVDSALGDRESTRRFVLRDQAYQVKRLGAQG